MLNWIWAILLLGAVATASINDARAGFACETLDAAALVAAGVGGPRTCMQLVTQGALDGANDAIQLLIKMVGGMILFLGLVRIASDAGLLRVIVRGLRRILQRFFPEIPEGHPAMGAMVMNLSANMLGLGNAATPFGVKAMIALDRTNPEPGHHPRGWASGNPHRPGEGATRREAVGAEAAGGPARRGPQDPDVGGRGQPRDAATARERGPLSAGSSGWRTWRA